MRVLVVNAGSSSLKLRLLDGANALVAQQNLPASNGRVDEATVSAALLSLPMADAIGHRFVHGGDNYEKAVRLNSMVLRDLHDLTIWPRCFP